MKFLLKIVQGPNAGAEIALVEGLRVTLGSADSCDIVLADPTLPAEVCAIEVSADSVALTPSGAAPETLAPFHVRSFGSTAIAVGPAESPWEPLVWAPSPEAAADAPENAGADDAAPAPAEREKAPANEEGGAAPTDNDASDAEPRPAAAKSRRRGLVAVLVALLAILLLVLLGAALWRASRAKAPSPAVEEAPIDPRARLEGLATDLGLVVVETNGAILVRGDFATRAERLAATAALYEARPGVALDLADRDTLLSAASDLLSAATDGALEVRDVTNRVAVLAGRVSDPAVLRSALESLRADVPRLAGADTAAVLLDSPIPAAPPPSGVTASAPRPSQAAARRAPPRLPLCGILLQPYPCLVLQDGRRLAVGAELSGYKIVEIAPDRIRVRGGDEEVIEWTP